MGWAQVSTQGLLAGRYRLFEVVHRETNRVSWSGDDAETGRPCLVTGVGLPEARAGGAASRAAARVLRTGSAVASLRPGRVAPVVDAVVADGSLWTVTGRSGGVPLGGLLDRHGAFGHLRAARVALELPAVLEAAHGQGITHGELSPGQVFVRDDGSVVVTGFGLAGTTLAPRFAAPAYASPEQARDERIGPADDLWTLGALLYTMVQGRPPFRDRGRPEATLRGVDRLPLRAPVRAGPLSLGRAGPAAQGLPGAADPAGGARDAHPRARGGFRVGSGHGDGATTRRGVRQRTRRGPRLGQTRLGRRDRAGAGHGHGRRPGHRPGDVGSGRRSRHWSGAAPLGPRVPARRGGPHRSRGLVPACRLLLAPGFLRPRAVAAGRRRARRLPSLRRAGGLLRRPARRPASTGHLARTGSSSARRAIRAPWWSPTAGAPARTLWRCGATASNHAWPAGTATGGSARSGRRRTRAGRRPTGSESPGPRVPGSIPSDAAVSSAAGAASRCPGRPWPETGRTPATSGHSPRSSRRSGSGGAETGRTGSAAVFARPGRGLARYGANRIHDDDRAGRPP